MCNSRKPKTSNWLPRQVRDRNSTRHKCLVKRSAVSVHVLISITLAPAGFRPCITVYKETPRSLRVLLLCAVSPTPPHHLAKSAAPKTASAFSGRYVSANTPAHERLQIQQVTSQREMMFPSFGGWFIFFKCTFLILRSRTRQIICKGNQTSVAPNILFL